MTHTTEWTQTCVRYTTQKLQYYAQLTTTFHHKQTTYILTTSKGIFTKKLTPVWHLVVMAKKSTIKMHQRLWQHSTAVNNRFRRSHPVDRSQVKQETVLIFEHIYLKPEYPQWSWIWHQGQRCQLLYSTPSNYGLSCLFLKIWPRHGKRTTDVGKHHLRWASNNNSSISTNQHIIIIIINNTATLMPLSHPMLLGHFRESALSEHY